MLAKIILLASLCSLTAGSHHFEDKHSAPQPYRFGYEVKDKEGAQYRHEEGDGHGSVKGSYGYTDDKGIYREVHYVADKEGFRAKINTNEPGTSNQDSADVEIQSNSNHHSVHDEHHSPVYHKAEVRPIYHKVEVVPVQPHKHYHDFRSYNNFSPIHGYSYKPFTHFRHRPSLSYNNGFRSNFGGHLGNFNIHNNFGYGNLGNNFGYNNLGNNFGNLNNYNNEEVEKFIEDLKNKKYSNVESFSNLENLGNINGYNNIPSLGNLDDFHNFGGFDNIKGYSNIEGLGQSYGYNGINKGNIDKLIEEAKHLNTNGYSGNNDNNNFHFKEFRNIGDHKYSRSSDSDFSN